MSEWIRCTDRLPDVGDSVIIFDGEEVVTATLAGLGVKFDGSAVFWGYEDGYAGKVRFYSEFWMPKPAPPTSCFKCGGTGQMDSGGTQPWGDAITVACDCQHPNKTPINKLLSQSLIEAAPELFSTLKTITDNCYGLRTGFEFKWDHDTSLDGLELLNKAKELVSRLHIENDGWIEWRGEMAMPPLANEVMVEVRLRSGTCMKDRAKTFRWRNHINHFGDIIAYRVIENDEERGDDEAFWDADYD